MANHIKGRNLSCSFLTLAVPLLSYSFLSGAAAYAQGSPWPTTGQTGLRMNDVKVSDCDLQKSLEVTVLGSAKAHLDRQSLVSLHDEKRDVTVWQTTSSESQLTFCSLDFGDYDVEVNAVGYLTQHKVVHVTTEIQGLKLEVILEKDPTAVDLNASDNAIPAKARKDAMRAVNSLRSGNLKDAQKRLEDAYKVAPSSAQLNFLMGYLFLQLKDLGKSETYLTQSAGQDPRRVQSLALLGRVQLLREHYQDAETTLERAVSVDPEYWMAHNLLGDVYLKQRDYEKAQEQALLAIDKSKGAGSVAQLVLGQALANVGRDREGIKALKTFIEANPGNAAVPQVQAVIAEIEKRDADGVGTGFVPVSADLALTASTPALPESAWGPPGVDDVKPSVATGVPCPYDEVMRGTGEQLKQLVDNMARFAAVEDLVHQQLDKAGNPITRETRRFNYIATITETPAGLLETTEDRNLRYGVSDLPDHIVTSGFVSLALVFHPDLRDNFQMTCEGLGDWHGQAAWLMYFRQRDDKPNTFAEYVAGSEHYPMKLKGRAWITAHNFQIVHMESDLVTPLPQLSVQHQMAEYGPIGFPKKNVELWLPLHVDIYMEFNRHYYHRQHSFDHYMLFSVDSSDTGPLNKKAPPGNAVQNR
jgi:tetratricopeptide (TPR) repeat protein